MAGISRCAVLSVPEGELPLLQLLLVFLAPDTSFLQHRLQLYSPDCIFSHRKVKPALKAETTFNTLNITASTMQEQHHCFKTCSMMKRCPQAAGHV